MALDRFGQHRLVERDQREHRVVDVDLDAGLFEYEGAQFLLVHGGLPVDFVELLEQVAEHDLDALLFHHVERVAGAHFVGRQARRCSSS